MSKTKKTAKALLSLCLVLLLSATMLLPGGDAGWLRSAVQDITGTEETAVSASGVSCVQNSYWYNGRPDINPQANNTFSYNGNTHGKTFTSKPMDARILGSEPSYSGVTKVIIAGVDLSGNPSTQAIFLDSFNEYLSGGGFYNTTVADALTGLPHYAGPDVRAKYQAWIDQLGPNCTWMDVYALEGGFDSAAELTQAIQESFWTRNMWRFSVDGVTSWCMEPLNPNLSDVTVTDPSAIMGTDQMGYLAGLVMSAATEMGAGGDDAMYSAAQCLVWELVDGLLNYNDLSHTGGSTYYNGIIVGNGLQAQYEAIKAQVSLQRKIPSFLSGDFSHKKYGETKTYFYGATWNVDHYDLDDELILTDWNGLVLNWTWTDTGVYHFEPIDANHLKVTANTYSATPMGATKFRQTNMPDITVGAVTWVGTGQNQGAADNYSDPYGGWMDISMRAGASYKVDAEGGFPVAGNTGAQVTITGPGYDGATVYDVNDLPTQMTPGTYTITEVHAPMFDDEHLGYTIVGAAPVTITITDETSSNWYTMVWNALHNTRQKGQITVQKVDGAQTYLNHANYYDEFIDCVICHENFLECAHTAEEYKAYLAEKYSANGITRGVTCPNCGGAFPTECACTKEEYIAAFAANRPLDIRDAFYTGHDMRVIDPLPQGDATLQGAVFEIYAKEDIVLSNGDVTFAAGALVETITTDATGLAVSSANLDLGVYEVREATPPDGYQYYNYKAASTANVIVDLKYSGDETQAVQQRYVECKDSVIMGHLSVTKYLSHAVDNDIFGNDATGVDTKIPMEGVYYAVYLDSKTTGANASLTRLPDEFFIPTSLDANAPVCRIVEGEGEVIDGYHYGAYEWVGEDGRTTGEKINPTLAYPVDTDATNAALKSLYMVLRTNNKGKAATYDVKTVTYINLPLIAGGADNDVGFTQELNVKDYSLPLPYGTYTVTELNPPEAYDQGTVNGGAHGVVTWKVTIGHESEVPVGEGPYVKTDINDHKYELINDVIQQKIYVYKVDSDLYVRETESEGGEPIFELAPEGGLIPIADVTFKLWCWNNEQSVNVWVWNDANGEAIGDNHSATDLDKAGLGEWLNMTIDGQVVRTWAWYEADGTISATRNSGGVGDTAKGAYTNYGMYADTYDPADIGNTQFGYWYTYTYFDDNFDEVTIDKFATDANGMFEIPTRLVYGDYSLVELNAPFGYWLPDPDNTDVGDVPLDADGKPQAWIGFFDEATGEFVYVPDRYGNTYEDVISACQFTVDNADPDIVLTVDVKNAPQKGYVVLSKTGLRLTKADEVIEGDYTMTQPVFEEVGLVGARYGLYADGNIVSQTGELYHTDGELVCTFDTDNNGLAVSEPVHLGTYVLKEIRAPYGYLLDETEYPVEFAYQGEEIRIFPIAQEAFDVRQEVEFKVFKESEDTDGKFIPSNGIKFGLYANQDFENNVGEVVIHKDDLLEVIDIVNGEGNSQLDLPVGKYYVQELETNDELAMDYHKYEIEFKYTVDGAAYDNPEAYDADVTGAGVGETVLEIELNGGVAIKNYRKRADVELFKYDVAKPATLEGLGVDDEQSLDWGMGMKVTNPDTAMMLPSAEFDLLDADGVVVSHLTTNANGYVFYKGGLVVGKYTLVETKAPAGYKFDEENPTTIEFEVTAAMVDEIITLRAENEGKDGLHFTKKDVSTGTVIPNCKVQIKDEDGNVVVQGTTDKDGIIVFDELAPGKYTYQEYEAPAGYIIDESEFPFEIVAGGGIVKAVMSNKKAPTPEVPTGPSIGIIKLFWGRGTWNPLTGEFTTEEVEALDEVQKDTTAKKDNTLLIVVCVVLGLAAAGLGTVLVVRNEKSKKAKRRKSLNGQRTRTYRKPEDADSMADTVEIIDEEADRK